MIFMIYPFCFLFVLFYALLFACGVNRVYFDWDKVVSTKQGGVNFY